MYTLYTCNKEYTSEPTSFAPQLFLEEIGADYKLVKIDLHNIQESYFAFHPRGKIPVLVVDATESIPEKLVINPSASILLYLGEQNPAANLLSAIGTKERAYAYKWIIYLSEELQSSYMMDSFPERYCMKESQIPFIEEKAALLIDEAWTEIDKALESKPYLLGDSYSIVDMYWYMAARWSRIDYHKYIEEYPHVARSARLIEARGATRRLLKKNKMPSIFRR